jgi:hypothetical protein
MTPSARGNLRPILLSAVAGLAIGAAVFAFSRGDDATTARGSGAPLLPSALPSAGASATTGLPPESAAEQGGRYYAVFLAVAADANDEKVAAAQRRAKALGYEGGIGELGCTAGAREQLKLPQDGTYTAYSIFFDSKERAERFVQAYGDPVVGIARITAGCLD